MQLPGFVAYLSMCVYHDLCAAADATAPADENSHKRSHVRSFFCKKWQLQFKFSSLFVLPCCCCCCYRFSKIPSHASDKLTENKICQGGDRHRIRLYQQPFCIPGFESQLSKSTRLFSSSM